ARSPQRPAWAAGADEFLGPLVYELPLGNACDQGCPGKARPGALNVLAINAGESRKEALQFIDFLQAPFVWALDQDLTVADAYGVEGLPGSFFIDSTGVIQAAYRGHGQGETFERLVGAAISAQPAGEPPPFLRDRKSVV